MSRTSIDFHEVLPKHRALDVELRNWARWIKPGRGGSGTHPMFRYYRSSDVHEAAPLNVEPIRPMDAMRMEKAITAMPERHRISLQWCYYYCHQGASIAVACRALAVSNQGLIDLIHTARQMLTNCTKEVERV
jgi:hypothetical protein